MKYGTELETGYLKGQKSNNKFKLNVTAVRGTRSPETKRWSSISHFGVCSHMGKTITYTLSDSNKQ